MSETSTIEKFLARLEVDDRDDLPLIMSDEFASLSLPWRVSGYGPRPVDHIVRDLLFGSLGRDYRAKLYNRLRREPPAWIAAAARPAAEVEIDAPPSHLINHLILRLIHARHLAQLILGDGDGDDEIEGERLGLIRALDSCPPVGFLFAGVDGGQAPWRATCWRSRACPWCHCRRVVRLYRRLIAGLCDPDRAGRKLLVMAKVRVVDDAPDGVESECLTRERVEWVLSAWRPGLRWYGEYLGMAGGLVGYQVGPVRLEDGRRSFCHELSLLGEVDCDAAGTWSGEKHKRFRGRAGFRTPSGWQPALTDRRGGGGRVPIEVTAMRMADRKALRWLLAGSPAHRRWGDPARATIERNVAARTHHGAVRVRKAQGVDGALALQPTFLFTAEQFWSHLEATHNRKLYAMFGSWAAIKEVWADDESGRFWAAALPSGGGRDAAEILGLCEEARPLYEEMSRALGRPPGRVAFGRALEEIGRGQSRRRVVEMLWWYRNPPAPLVDD
jgi:hypothetical protein